MELFVDPCFIFIFVAATQPYMLWGVGLRKNNDKIRAHHLTLNKILKDSLLHKHTEYRHRLWADAAKQLGF